MHRLIRKILLCAATAVLLQACSDSQSNEPGAAPEPSYRFATFNIAMGLKEQGAMAEALQSGTDSRLKSLATVLQTVRPDMVLLEEFDYDPSIDSAGLLQRNYLQHAGDGREPIFYPYSLQPEVNTGVDSGLDLNSNGILGEPNDAWGFGTFPGQYGMLILSRFPIDEDAVRSFRLFRWSWLPGALQPHTEDGEAYYPPAIWELLRLSSKNHLDVPVQIGGRTVHLLVSHPTPPIFDGPEDRNGFRNHDELAFWANYITYPDASWIIDDEGTPGGLPPGATFLILGDLNADPVDGDGYPGTMAQLLDHQAIDASCVPMSKGGAEASLQQGGVNLTQRGDPAADTSDFNDNTTGNLHLDFLLPSRDLSPVDCGVFWPESTLPLHEAATFSDHRLVWIDLRL